MHSYCFSRIWRIRSAPHWMKSTLGRPRTSSTAWGTAALALYIMGSCFLPQHFQSAAQTTDVVSPPVFQSQPCIWLFESAFAAPRLSCISSSFHYTCSFPVPRDGRSILTLCQAYKVQIFGSTAPKCGSNHQHCEWLRFSCVSPQFQWVAYRGFILSYVWYNRRSLWKPTM